MSEMATKKPPEYLREARLRAGYCSRTVAANAVPYSPETIGRHERGDVEMEPEDALTYARIYGSPDILPRYCATCPVGRAMGKTADSLPLPFATLRISRLIEDAQAVADSLEHIAFDGKITPDEIPAFEQDVRFLRQLAESIESICIIAAEKTKTALAVAPAKGGNSGT